jgi:hypothetical protein
MGDYAGFMRFSAACSCDPRVAVRTTTLLLLAPFVSLPGCRDEATAAKATPFSVDGTLTLDGKAETVQACKIEKRGLDQAVALTLASGAIVTIPLHERDLHLDRTGKGEAKPLTCETGKKTEASNAWVKTEIDAKCTGEETKLELAMLLECGTEGPSNRVDDDDARKKE